MALSRVRFGNYISLVKEKCGISVLSPDEVSGINKDKDFFEPSKQVGNDTTNYKIVPPNCFACNIMHVGRDKVLPISLNQTNKNKIVSPAYTVFQWLGDKVLLKEFLFMMLKSMEKDRYFWFHCDSSVRDGMDWGAFCDIELDVPPIEIQKKYVAIYEAMLDNLRSYEKGLKDLKLVCDVYIEKLRKAKGVSLKGLLIESDEKNSYLIAKEEKGVSIQKEFINTKAKAKDISKQKLVKKNYFAFISTTSRNSDRISIALNKGEPCAVSATYTVFSCNSNIVPEYLYLWFKRSEFDRFARFNSWGSARETISLQELEKTEIALPSIETQKAIVKILSIYQKRKDYFTLLCKETAKICPILIRGAIADSEGDKHNGLL